MPNKVSRQVRVLASLAGPVTVTLVLLILGLPALIPRPQISTEGMQFPTRPPCTPVSDPFHPPLYPDAQQVSVVPAATREWLSVMYTTTFQTRDSPETVLAFYREEMSTEGWTPVFQLSEDLKAPSTYKYGYLEPDLANLTDIVDVLGFAAFCGTTSAHPIYVNVVIRVPKNSLTEVDLRVY